MVVIGGQCMARSKHDPSFSHPVIFSLDDCVASNIEEKHALNPSQSMLRSLSIGP